MRDQKGIADLACFVGSWQGNGVFHPTPLASGRPMQCIELAGAMWHRDRWLVQRLVELDAPEQANPLEATRIWGYEASSGVFVCEWFDAHGRRATVRSAGWEGDRLATVGTASSDGRSVSMREVFTRRGDDEIQHVGEMDFGAGWVVTDEQVFRRSVSHP
jgi:uncharacterized protein YodC (DUF2158 family)